MTIHMSFNVDSSTFLSLNVGEFVHSLQVLEQQKNGAINKELMLQPLMREGLEEVQPCDIPELKEYLERVRKLQAKVK